MFPLLNFVSIFYDVLAVVIVINCIAKGAKNGFAKTAIQTIGYIFSAIAALVISRICASLIYTTAIHPAIIANMEESLANAVDTESVVKGLSEAVESLPAISGFLFDFSGVTEELIGSIGFDYSEIAAVVESSVIRPVVEPILETVIFVVSIIILGITVSFVAKGSKFVNDVPVIGGFNSFFGGIFGIADGIIKLGIGAFILEFVISAGLFPEYFSEEIISETLLFKWIYFALCGDNAII